MRTVDEIINFIRTNKATPMDVFIEKGYANYRNQVEFMTTQLRNDEDVVYAMFIGTVYDGKSVVINGAGGLGALFITNKRIVYGRKAGLLMGGTRIKSINIDEGTDVSSSDFGIMSGRIIINTRNEQCSFEVGKKVASNIFGMVNNAIQDVLEKRQSAQGGSTTIVQQASSPAEELKKFKELLDMGILTQEEFDAKKKQLLGL